MPTKTLYEKVAGIGFGASGFARLWSGPDHLMEVTAYGFSESYRRFYWREIEAVIVRRTAVRLIWNLISGSIAALSVAGLMACLHYSAQTSVRSDLVALGLGIGLCWILIALSSVVLIVNSLLGPRCACVIQVPAGTFRLAAPTRLRTAKKVLEKIAPRIELAQTTTP